jgi:hypothetical protein
MYFMLIFFGSSRIFSGVVLLAGWSLFEQQEGGR